MGITIKMKTSASTQATAQKISSAFVGVILKSLRDIIDIFAGDIMLCAIYLCLLVCGELLINAVFIVFNAIVHI